MLTYGEWSFGNCLCFDGQAKAWGDKLIDKFSPNLNCQRRGQFQNILLNRTNKKYFLNVILNIPEGLNL